MTFGIYCIEHIASGRRYVGKSKHIEQRIKGHRKAARGARMQTFLCHALRKYGWEAFRWYVLEEVTPETPENLAVRELHWIDTLAVFGTAEGFNTRRDSSSGTSFSEEVKRKIAASVKKLPVPDAMRRRWETPMRGEDNPFFGRNHSEESRRAMGVKVAAKWQDPEFLVKMAGRPSGRGNTGKKARPETRAKQSAAKKGKPPPNLGVKYEGATLERMRLGYVKRSVACAAKKLRGLDTVDIYL